MRRYFREAVAIWYWGLFRPELLQFRLNELAPHKNEDGSPAETPPNHVLFAKAGSAFSAQYLILVLLLSSPFIPKLVFRPNLPFLLFLVFLLLCTYGLSVISLSWGTSVPLVLVFIYFAQGQLIESKLQEFWTIVPPLTTVTFAVLLVTVCFVLACAVGQQLSEVERAYSPGLRNWLVATLLGVLVASFCSFLIGTLMWLANMSPTKIAIITSIAFLWLFAVLVTRRSEHSRGTDDGTVELTVMISVVGVFASIITVLVVLLPSPFHFTIENVVVQATAIMSSLIVTGVFLFTAVHALLPARPLAKTTSNSAKLIRLMRMFFLLYFSLVVGTITGAGIASTSMAFIGVSLFAYLVLSWFIAATFSPPKKTWPRIAVISGVLSVLGFLRLGWTAIAVPVASLLGYCRLVPDYAAFVLICSFGVSQLPARTYRTAVRCLRWLPPNSSSLLWLRIPGHDRILVRAFHADPVYAADTLNAMQSAAFPSLRTTADKALPQILADRLAEMTSVQDLISIVAVDSPLRPLMPLYYKDRMLSRISVGQQTTITEKPFSQAPEISTVFPRLETIAADVGVALKIEPSLRELALIKCKDDVKTYDKELAGLGYDGTVLHRWRAVSDRWEQVLDEEVKRQQNRAFKDIRNPFQPGTPLRRNSEHLFKGRKKFASEILKQILEESHKTIVLHGPRRCGKTSFLYYLPTLLSSRVIPVFIDLQAAGATNNDGDFFFNISKCTVDQAKEKQLEIPVPRRRDFKAEPFTTFDDWLTASKPKFGSNHILLCFDEFEVLGDAHAKNRLTSRVFDHLRHLIQHSTDLSFLFAGGRTLDELGPNWSSYFINTYPIEMVYLEPEEAKNLLTEPDPNFQLTYDEGIVEKVLNQTRNHPLLIHLLGDLLVTQANNARTRIITEPLLSNAVEQSLHAGAPYFNNQWDEVTGNNREEIIFGRTVLDAVARDSPIPRYGTSKTQSVLKRLQRFHLIELDNFSRYRIKIPLFQQWILKHAIIEPS